MEVTVIFTGKTTDDLCKLGIERYAKRIMHYMPFNLKVIPEPKHTRNLSENEQKSQEGAQLLKLIDKGDYVVLLDEHGHEKRSIEFAAWLEKVQASVRRIFFVIGGPYGFSNEVYSRANYKISLSAMTFSHQMVRMIFLEQLYRACTIINHEPYHHE